MTYPWLGSYEPGVAHSINENQYKNVIEVLEEVFDKFSSKSAFSNFGQTMTYRELDEASKRFASYLQHDLKLQKGDRVAIMMPNLLQYPIALFGILRAGMIVVNVNPLYTARELEHQLKDSEAKAIVIFANSAKVLEQIRMHTMAKHVIVSRLGDRLSFPKSVLMNFAIKYVKKMEPSWNIPGVLWFNDVLEKADPLRYHTPDVASDDIAFLQYTGGTTGVSKGAMLTHKNFVANVLQVKEWVKNHAVDGKEIAIAALPLYHIFSLTVTLVFCCLGGMSVLITNPKDIPGFINELKKWKFSVFTGVNTLFKALANNPEIKNVDFSALKISLGGGMAVQKATALEWKSITGKTLREGYGLTETSPVACVYPMNLDEYNGTIGLPVPSTILQIKNDEGAEVPVGEVGELCIKGPQVMKGYWKRPDETAQVMTSDGFFRTGDLGFMNPQGYIKIVDRKKDMILVSGFNVYPNEVEDIVCMHPKVLECAAIGVPNDHSGEVVKVFVVKRDQSLTEQEVIDFCRQNMTNYKVPKFVEFRADLPKSNVGKILRRMLKDAPVH